MKTVHDRARPGAAPDRRLAPGQAGSARLRWLRGLMRRPLALRWRGGGPQLVWVERRHQPLPDDAVARLRADLHTELLSHANAAQALRELVQVDERLGRAGWAGLAALPAQVISRAQMQADMLATSTGSVPLAGLAARLRALQPAADALDAQAEAELLRHGRADDAVEVSELGEDAYTEAEEAWASSQIGDLAPPTPTPPPNSAPKDGKVNP